MRTWRWLLIWLILVLLMGCSSPKNSPQPTFSLVPTRVPPTATAETVPTAVATPTSPPPTAIPSPTPTEIPLAARVNGQPIYLADYEREVALAGETVPAQAVLEAMIENALLEQAAASAGVTVSEEQLDDIIEADIDALGGREVFEARLASNNISEEAYRETVRANLVAQRVQMRMIGEVPDTAEHVHARHILVATQEEAEAILTQLRDGADFATLAQTYSLDVTTRDRGGDLDFFPRGVLVAPEVEETAFALSPGQISDVVYSELLGYHLVQVLEREERPISEMNLEIIKANQRESIRRWREQLWADAAIERFIEP